MSTTFFQKWSRFTDSWVNFKTFNSTYAKKDFTDTYDIHIQSVRYTVDCRMQEVRSHILRPLSAAHLEYSNSE